MFSIIVAVLFAARSKFGAPVFAFEVFWKQCTVLKKVLVILLGLRRSRSHSAPTVVIRRPP